MMPETGYLGGECADLNALYVGLARAAGLPARDVYCIRVAKSGLGYKAWVHPRRKSRRPSAAGQKCTGVLNTNRLAARRSRRRGEGSCGGTAREPAQVPVRVVGNELDGI